MENDFYFLSILSTSYLLCSGTVYEQMMHETKRIQGTLLKIKKNTIHYKAVKRYTKKYTKEDI